VELGVVAAPNGGVPFGLHSEPRLALQALELAPGSIHLHRLVEVVNCPQTSRSRVSASKTKPVRRCADTRLRARGQEPAHRRTLRRAAHRPGGNDRRSSTRVISSRARGRGHAHSSRAPYELPPVGWRALRARPVRGHPSRPG
jgi:hypothetical protein